MLLGSHLSVAGGLVNALAEAEQLGLDCVQVFTRNQRQWKASPIRPTERDEWLTQLAATQWHTPVPDFSPGHRVVSHGSYLINLASPNDELWQRSMAAHRAELERCEALEIAQVVIHPGAHLGQPRPPRQANDLEGLPTADELAGLRRIVSALDRIHADLPGYQTITCMETTTGSGTNLGYQFDHLRFLREECGEPERVGYCLDTCHVTAAGYDMSTDAAAEAVLDEFHESCNLKHVRVIHLNDSIGALGSRKDCHAHIGQGVCGTGCFRAVLNHSRLERVPQILETPNGRDDKGDQWDVVNIRRLRRLAGRPSGSLHPVG